ncbi:centromere protein U isoform X2 [Heterocephalus glaber]|uniref:Centromere protein U n=1 Tax=Heterocephalus glaber TaxID=10181 RepID=A0AAX6TJS4_HETGA|nr:centromere protein U isoform X2 [Heterocephalus glaber]
MALRWRVRSPGRAGARYSKNTLGGTHSVKEKAGQKYQPPDVFDFTDNLVNLSRLSENEKDEEPYETFDPPLHSTALYADEEEFSKHCGLSIPSTPEGKGRKKSSNTSENEASEDESVKICAEKRRRKLNPFSDESESSDEGDLTRKVKSTEKISTQQHKAVPAVAPSESSEKPAGPVTPRKTGHLRAQSFVEKETQVTQSQPKIQKKRKLSPGKRKRSRSKATDSGTRQKMESKVCTEAINKFYVNIKEELIRMLKEVQMLKNLKRKNAKMISDMEKKRQRLIEVQDELLRLEPQLKQLQTKYDELKERKSSLRNATYFLSNLKQLYQDYSDVQEKEPNVKETYDSSSLPALLFKARTLLGAENHLQNINRQLEKLLDQE